MLDKTEILDCTLRDGSYVNNFQFTKNDTKKILIGLSSWYANELVESENKLITGFTKWAEKNQHLWKEFVTGVPFKRDYMAKNYYCNLQ